MARMVRPLRLLVTLALVAGLAGNAAGQQPGCSSTFFSALLQLVPCRAAVTTFSPYPPSDACCNAVRVLGQPCLCLLVDGPPITGIDRNMALQLPLKCGLQFQPCPPPALPVIPGLPVVPGIPHKKQLP